MTYNIDWIKEKYDSDNNFEYIFFWGHTNKTNVVNKTCFSQWYEIGFKNEGINYKTAEHWMMYNKAKLFNNHNIAKQILQCRTPGEAKELGRKVTEFDL